MSDYQEEVDSLITLFTQASMAAAFDAHGNHDVHGFMLTAADSHTMMDIMDMNMNDFKTRWHDSRNTLADDERNEIMFACEQGMHYDERKDESMNILNEMSA